MSSPARGVKMGWRAPQAPGLKQQMLPSAALDSQQVGGERLRGGAHRSLQGTCPVAASSQGFPVTSESWSGAMVTCSLVFSAPALKWHIVPAQTAGRMPGELLGWM